MTREEAIQGLDHLYQCIDDIGDKHTKAVYKYLRTYILNSIPTPTVEWTGRICEGSYIVEVNGVEIWLADEQGDDLRAALGIEVKP